MQTMRFLRGPWCPWHVELVTAGEDRVLMLGMGHWRWLFDVPLHGRPDAAPLILSCPRWRAHVRDAWEGWHRREAWRREREQDEA